MSNISKKGGLSQAYSNHCIRATSFTVLAHNDVSPGDIINVTGHKDQSSLAHYIVEGGYFEFV